MESTSAPPPGHDHGFDIAEAVADAVFVVGPDARILSWNSGAERMYGVSAADAVGSLATDIVATDGLPGVGPAGDPASMEPQGRWAGRVTQTRRDGTAIVVDGTSMRVTDGDGAVLGIVMVNRDVTGQVRAEEQWRRLGAILDSTSDAVVTVDADDVVVAWNAGAESLFGVPASGAVGSRAHRLVGWEALDDTRDRAALWQDLRAGVEWRGRVRLSTPLGSRIVDCRSMPQLDGEGRLVTVTSVARDVTDRELLVVEREQRHALLQSLAGSLDDAMSDPSASLGPVLESLVAAGTDVAMLWLADAMRESVGLADVRDRDPSWNQRWHETLGATRFALGEGIVGGVVAGGEPYVRLELAAADVRGDAASVAVGAGLERIPRSLIVLPVRYAGEVIGALSLGRYEGSRPYTEDDVTYLQEFAATVDGFVGIARLLARLQRQSRVLEDVHDAVFAVDTVGAVTYWSRSAEDYFEIPAGDALGRPLADVLATTGEPADWLAHGWRELGRRGEWSDRVHLTSRSGRELDLDVRARTIVDVDGRPSGTVLVTHDVTELLGAYRQRERESAFAAAVLQSLPDATVVVDEQLHFIAGNNLYREQLEPFPEALEPGSDLLALADRLLAGVEDWPGIRAGLLDVAAGRQELLEAEMPLPTQPPQWIALQATWLPFEGGGLVLSEWDVTERKASEARLQRAATLDPLTRLANRDALLARLETALGRAAAARRSVGVMFVDLDRFKLVNDTLGHAAGDEVLVHTARVLRAHVRADDLVARLGGDEFVVVAEVADPHALDRLARRLVDALAEPVATRAGTAIGGASIGIRLLPPDEPRPHDPMALVDDADAAMFEAKSAGRNRHAWAHGGPGRPRADRPGA